MTEFIIPERCQQCPVQRDFADRHQALRRVGAAVMCDATSLIGPQGQAFDAMIDELAPTQACADEFKAQTRKGFAQTADMIDEQQKVLQADAADCALTCAGPLKMRAPKDGKTYTATLCTSDLAELIYEADSENVPVDVQVDVQTPKQWFNNPQT